MRRTIKLLRKLPAVGPGMRRLPGVAWLFLLLLIVISPEINGQSKLQVIEKTIKKEIPYKAGKIIRVEAEKAKVRIAGWDKNYMKFNLKLTARNENREVAERELSYMKYAITLDEDAIILGNTFILPPSTNSIKSQLMVEYEIFVPTVATTQLMGRYSDVEVSNLTNGIGGTFQFGSLNVQNVKGFIKINSSFTDIDISLTESLTGVTIISSKGNITIAVPDLHSYNYVLSVFHGSLFLEDAGYNALIVTEHDEKTFKKTSRSKPSIKVSNSYGTVKIDKQ